MRSGRLIAIQGEKLPQEKCWVTSEDMYEVYSKIDLMVDGAPMASFIVTDILEQGLVVETLQ